MYPPGRVLYAGLFGFLQNGLLPGGLDIRKCRARAVSYQGLFNVLVSFVLPLGKIVGSLLTFPFRQAGQSWGNAYS